MEVAMVVTWTEPIPGREIKAIEYGADVAEYWTRQSEAGKCSAPELFFSEGGHSLWMVKGDQDTLRALHDSDESQNLITRGTLLLNDFCVEFMTAGETSNALMARYATLAGAFA